jgi:4'-phosphopantetheinyl transferase
LVIVAVVSDPAQASALISDWANSQDRADARRGRGARSSLLARAALRALLAQHTGRFDWQIVRTPLGKPFVVTPSGTPGPAVSLSHSGTTVAVAMAESGSLGLDIEQHRARDYVALAAQAFGPAEQSEVAVSGADAFYRVWTLREAVAKATGEGLALAADGRDLVAGNAAGWIEHAGRIWRVAHVRIEPACSLAVAHEATSGEAWAGLRWSDIGTPASMRTHE